jgi:hypothetical protein
MPLEQCIAPVREDVLQNVLSVARVGHAATNEVAQPGLLPRDHIRHPLGPFDLGLFDLVLFECHPLQARRTLPLEL